MLDCLNSGVESTQDLDFNNIFWLLLVVKVDGREKAEQPSQLWGVGWTLVLGLSNSVLATFDVFLLFLRRHTVQSLRPSTAVLLSTMSQRKTQCGSKWSLLTFCLLPGPLLGVQIPWREIWGESFGANSLFNYTLLIICLKWFLNSERCWKLNQITNDEIIALKGFSEKNHTSY